MVEELQQRIKESETALSVSVKLLPGPLSVLEDSGYHIVVVL